MTEWFLILSVALSANSTSFRDVSVETHSGFTSKQSCEIAGSKISKTTLKHANKFRQNQGVTKNSTNSIGYPMILFDCLAIKK